MISIKDIKNLAEIYVLQELKKGEHPNDIEFEIIDAIADTIDQLSTDEDGNRVYFEESIYYKESEEMKKKR